MQAIELSAVGFGPFLEEVVIQLHERGLVLLDGRNYDSTSTKSNGAGKTSVLKAVTWCVFGKFVDGDKGSEVVHKRAKRAEVKMIWLDEDTGTAYCITRTQAKNAQALSLEMTAGDEWVSICGRDKQETQSKIEAILGLDYETWCNTVLFAAGNLTRFASRGTSDADRKSMLKQIYGLGVVDDARDVVVKMAREVRLKLDEAEKAVIRRKAQIETIDLRDLDIKRAAFERDRAEEIKQCEEAIVDLEQKMKASGPDLELLASTKQLLDVVNLKLSTTREKYHALAAAARAESAALDEDRVQAERNRLSEVTADLAVVQRQLKQMRDDRCPICRTSFVEAGAARQFRDELMDQERVLADEVTKLHAVVSENDSSVRKRKADLRTQLDHARRLEEEIGDLQREQRKAEQRITTIESTPPSPFARIIVAKQAQLEQLQVQPNTYDAIIIEAKERLAKWQELLVEETKATTALKEELSYFTFWNEAFSDRGLITFTIDQMLPMLNRKMNEKLQVLSDGDIMVIFDGESLLKSGEVRDKVGVRSMIEGIENATPSTAQDRKISLAGALAMMEVVASRQGKQIDLQMLDEPFDGLDEVGKQRLVSLLQQQQQARSTILVTTHDAAAAGAFTRRVTVERRGGVARLVEDDVPTSGG